VLDWFALSEQFITFFNGLEVSAHLDSLHWCAAGLTRGANLLLQDALESVITRQGEMGGRGGYTDKTMISSSSSVANKQRESYRLDCEDYKFGYVIQEGMIPRGGHESNLRRLVYNKSTHHCKPAITNALLNVHLEPLLLSSTSENDLHSSTVISTGVLFERKGVFDPFVFLTQIRDKLLVIIGDDEGRQVFHAIDHDLNEYQTYYHNGNGTHSSNSLVCKKLTGRCGYIEPMGNRHHAAIRFYELFNATIFYCYDATLYSVRMQKGSWYDYCGKKASTGDIIIVAVSSKYKPFGLSLIEYYNELVHQEKKLLKDLTKFRTNILTRNPTAQLIWRTIPFSLGDDERHYVNEEALKLCYSNTLWLNGTFSLNWISRHNFLFRHFHDVYGEEILDLFSLSIDFMSYFYPQNVQYPLDSQFWCAGGLNRVANLLIQDALYNLRHKKTKLINNVSFLPELTNDVFEMNLEVPSIHELDENMSGSFYIIANYSILWIAVSYCFYILLFRKTFAK
jgi:hypothetical protein